MTSIVLEAVKANADQRPEALALIDGEIAVSYETLWLEVVELAINLAPLGDGKSAVGLYLDNCPAWVALDLAFIALGWPSIPVPTFFTQAQRRHALNQSGAQFLVADGPMPGCLGTVSFTLFNRLFYFHTLEGPAVELPANTAKITYTSGSTGQPKGVCLPQSGLEHVAEALVSTVGTSYAGVHCAVLPLTVLLENVAGLYSTLLAGGAYYVPPPAQLGFAKSFEPDFSMLAQALAESSATSAIMVPGILHGLCQAMEDAHIALPSLKLLAVGGARVDGGLLKKATRLGLPVIQGYGLSEAASVVALNPLDANRPGSVGRPLPGADVELAADNEILVYQPAFLGYLGDGPAPACFATGDIGHFDTDGYLYIDGRKSARLITAFGRNISPEWVESALTSQPEIGQAIVFGDAAPALGALIVLSSLAVTDIHLAKAIARANSTLPDYALVKNWRKVAPFTFENHLLTANGRLRRLAIHDKYQGLMANCPEMQG